MMRTTTTANSFIARWPLLWSVRASRILRWSLGITALEIIFVIGVLSAAVSPHAVYYVLPIGLIAYAILTLLVVTLSNQYHKHAGRGVKGVTFVGAAGALLWALVVMLPALTATTAVYLSAPSPGDGIPIEVRWDVEQLAVHDAEQFGDLVRWPTMSVPRPTPEKVNELLRKYSLTPDAHSPTGTWLTLRRIIRETEVDGIWSSVFREASRDPWYAAMWAGVFCIMLAGCFGGVKGPDKLLIFLWPFVGMLPALQLINPPVTLDRRVSAAAALALFVWCVAVLLRRLPYRVWRARFVVLHGFVTILVFFIPLCVVVAIGWSPHFGIATALGALCYVGMAPLLGRVGESLDNAPRMVSASVLDKW